MSNILFFIKRNVKDIVLFGLIFVTIILVIFKFYYDAFLADQVEVTNIEPAEYASSSLIESGEEVDNFYVDIKGAVKNPGVYQVVADSIVNDVISLAGGFNSDAYKDGINLSKKITDEMVIYVYSKNEIKDKSSNIEEVLDETCKLPSYSICECVDSKASIIETGNSTITDSGTKALVNINTAGVTELTSLSGIGEAKAKAIIEYRDINGNFNDVSDIMNVSGIGESAFVKIKDFITV